MNVKTKFQILKGLLENGSYDSFRIENLILGRALKDIFSFKASWYDSYKNKNIELGPLAIDKESAYSEAVRGILKIADNKIYYSVIIYAYDAFNNLRIEERCIYTFEITEYNALLDHMFTYLLNMRASSLIKEREELAKDALFEATKKEILINLRKN